MKNSHLRIAVIVVFSAFAASSRSFASANDSHELSPTAQEQNAFPVDPRAYAFEANDVCMEESAQRAGDPFEESNMIPLASYQDCVNTCKAGIVAIEAMCRFIPDPRAKALCWAARFTTPACIGFCGWYFGK